LEAADQDPSNNTRILDVYNNAVYAKVGGGNTNYNREHTWPNSYGFNDAVQDAQQRPISPYTDCHMLYLSDIQYNSDRGNKPFAICTQASGCIENTTVVNNGSGGGSGTYPGNSNWRTTADGPNGSFEVWNRRKGDMARAILYMDIRYEGGNAGNGQAEPDLIVTNNRALIAQTASGSVASVGYMGILDTLLAWHAADPPDEQERLRNSVVFSFQGNRNPLIDHPEWAACLWQNQCGVPENVFKNGFEN
jgi:endonuclease I